MGLFALGFLLLGSAGKYLFNLFFPEAAEEDEKKPEPRPKDPSTTPRDDGPDEPEDKWTRPLGQTGAEVSIFGLGGGGVLARADRKNEAVELLQEALDLGVNYIDTAPTYGSSEQHIGEVMKTRRNEVFLATKTLDRSYDGTMELFETSLRALQTDYIDLYQLHGIKDVEDAEQALGSDGALRAMKQLKNEGVVRFIGVTGHRDPEPLCFLLEKATFDAALIPLNPAEVHFRSFKKQFVDFALECDVGIIAMKTTAYGRLVEPEGPFSMQKLLEYTCSLPISTAVVGLSSSEQLHENVQICRELDTLSEEEMQKLEQKAAASHQHANFFKTEW